MSDLSENRQPPAEIERRELLKRAGSLLGGFLSVPSALAILGDKCWGQAEAGGQPKLFDEQQSAAIEQLAELILPATDTPGAKSAGVLHFIDAAVRDVYSPQDRGRFLDGLERLLAAARARNGQAFIELTTEQQRDLLVAELKSAQENSELWRASGKTPFVVMLKELTILGYFTSRIGATETLRYDPMPGNYDACVPYSKGDRAWAT